MRLKLHAIFLLPLFASVAWLISAQSSGSDPDCIVRDQSPPPSLGGSGGHAPDYRFRHVADVDEQGNGKMLKYDYHHIILNDHPKNLLPAAWPTVNILFSEIRPGGCASDLSEYDVKPSPDRTSLIYYGPTLQFSSMAAAYVPQSTPPTPITQSQPSKSLRSRLYGQLMWNKENFTLDLTFQSRVTPTEGTFEYSATNKSSSNLVFRIPALTQKWNEYGVLDAALKSSGWRTTSQDPSAFSLASGTATLSLKASDAVEARGEMLELTIFKLDESNRLIRIASGSVSAYLPAQRSAPR